MSGHSTLAPPAASPALGRWTPADSCPATLLTDAHDPVHQAFVRQELLRGTIRTVPAGPGRLWVVPLTNAGCRALAVAGSGSGSGPTA